MYILKRGFFIIIVLSLFSCKPQGPLTPRDAFFSFKGALLKSDAKELVSLLSKESLVKIETMSKLLEGLKKEQRSFLAKKYGLSDRAFSKVSPENYMILYLYMGQKKDLLHQAFLSEIIKVHKDETTATISVSNGMELDFVREGPYWKFNMQNF